MDIVAIPLAEKVGGKPGQPLRTIMHTNLESIFPPNEKIVGRINDKVGTITGAAFKTVVQSIRTILYDMYIDPVTLSCLRGKLSQAVEKYGNGGHLPLPVLEQLPFLTGSICEGLRLSPGLTTRLAWVAPDPDLFYG
jgi:hypothetical protein